MLVLGDLMDLFALFEKYGWFVAIALWFVPKAWAFATEKFYPQRIKEREDAQKKREQETQAEREARATLLRAQIEREDRVAIQQSKYDERTVVALEQMALGISVGNERIAALIASHTQHANFQFGAHIELKDRLDDIQDMITYRKRIDELERKVSDTQEKIKQGEK